MRLVPSEQTMDITANKRGAGNGAITSLFQFEHQRRAVPDHIRWAYFTIMKRYFPLIACLASAGFLAGCDQKPTPVKEGIIWMVVWSNEPNTQTGLFRVKPAPTNSFGEYGVEMSGKLYPTFLEVQRAGSSHSRIIPISQIRLLEFGE